MEHQPLRWTLAQRFNFRFFALFLLLNMFPFPANIYPNEYFMDGLTYTIWQPSVQWTATHLLGIPGEISTQVTGSGDTTFHWIVFGLTLFFSLLGAVIWSVVDRHRAHYQTLMAWLRVYSRYYLAYMMFVYGVIKIYHLQMPDPPLYRLDEPFGEFSLMGVLWSFMGSSKAYSAFSGWAEVIAGSLLFFRRTTLLGAILCFAVMLNVFMLNMCYNVPVKLFSGFLLLTSAFLIAPDFARLGQFFIQQKSVAVLPEKPLFESKKWNVAAQIFKYIVVGWIVYSNIDTSIQGVKEYGSEAVPAPLSGIYKVKSFNRNDTLVPPLMTDSTYWKKLLVHAFPAGWGRITMANEYREYCTFKVDTALHQVDIHPVNDTLPNFFVYEQPDSISLILRGVWNKDSLELRLKKVDGWYKQRDRSFHWVNEYPNNQ